MTSTTISRTYHFESGHYLPLVRDGHKCKRQHGHNYKMDIVLHGMIDQVGFLIDFWDLDDIVHPIIKVVDHFNLNDIPGLENPTAENIAHWFFVRIQPEVAKFGAMPLRLDSVTIWETHECWARASEK